MAITGASSMGSAMLYRVVSRTHTCPEGVKAKDLLIRSGYDVEDHRLTTRRERVAFMAQHGVSATPQIFIDGIRIGGYDELRRLIDNTP